MLEEPEAKKEQNFAKRKRILYLGRGIKESEPVGRDTPVGATSTNLDAKGTGVFLLNGCQPWLSRHTMENPGYREAVNQLLRIIKT